MKKTIMALMMLLVLSFPYHVFAEIASEPYRVSDLGAERLYGNVHDIINMHIEYDSAIHSYNAISNLSNAIEKNNYQFYRFFIGYPVADRAVVHLILNQEGYVNKVHIFRLSVSPKADENYNAAEKFLLQAIGLTKDEINYLKVHNLKSDNKECSLVYSNTLRRTVIVLRESTQDGRKLTQIVGAIE